MRSSAAFRSTSSAERSSSSSGRPRLRRAGGVLDALAVDVHRFAAGVPSAVAPGIHQDREQPRPQVRARLEPGRARNALTKVSWTRSSASDALRVRRKAARYSASSSASAALSKSRGSPDAGLTAVPWRRGGAQGSEARASMARAFSGTPDGPRLFHGETPFVRCLPSRPCSSAGTGDRRHRWRPKSRRRRGRNHLPSEGGRFTLTRGVPAMSKRFVCRPRPISR